MNKLVLVKLDGQILAGEIIRSKSLPEWHHWAHMVRRCTDPKNSGYVKYGALGVSVHPLWLEFAQFYVDVGSRPTPKHSLDRYPNNAGNYEPGNVRWATSIEQSLNRKNAVHVEFEGRQQRLYDLALRFGISLNSVYGRLRMGWTLDEALTIPVNKHSAPTGKNIRLTRKKAETTP